MMRVFLVDDHALFRAGVRAEIGPHVDVVGEAGTVDEAVPAILATRPDVVVVDVHLPGGGGRTIIERVLHDWPDAVFLALSVSDSAEDVVAVIRAGARGYVTKTIDAPGLVDAIRRVRDGDAVFSPRLAGFVLDSFTGAAAESDDELDRLTPREREVMRLIARGYTYREVAAELVLSIDRLRDVSASPGTHDRHHVLGGVADGQRKEPCLGHLLSAALEHGSAIATRQMNIEQDDVGAGRQHDAHRLVDIARLPNDVDIVADLRPHS